MTGRISRRSFITISAMAIAAYAMPAWAKEPRETEEESGTKDDGTSEWSYGNVTVSYPSSWEVIEPKDGIPTSPNTLALAINGRDAVAVNVNDSNSMPISDAASLEFVASMMAASILQSDGLDGASVGQFSVEERTDGSFASTIPFEASQDGKACRFVMHMVAKDTVMVVITASAPEAEWDSLSDELARMFDSVKFGEFERFDGSKLEEVGEGSVVVSTSGGTTDAGNVPRFSAGNATMMQIGINVEDVEPGSYASYVDGLANTVIEFKSGVSMVQTVLTLMGDSLTPGIHTVELVRTDEDNVIFYRRAQYEVE